VLLEDLYTEVFGLGDVNLIAVVKKSLSYYTLYKLEERVLSLLLFDY
jgi:hypothetical protein